jgi:hypothetical protein
LVGCGGNLKGKKKKKKKAQVQFDKPLQPTQVEP